MAWLSQEKETTQKLLREFVLQLCRINVGNGGCYEVDGIICITRGKDASDGVDGEQIVVKVHEQVSIDLPTGSGTPFYGNSSVLKEYLSGHSNQSSSVIDRLDVVSHSVPPHSVPPLNLKRKANDENDNAILDIGREVKTGLSPWPQSKLMKSGNLSSDFVTLANGVNYDKFPLDYFPEDLTRSNGECSPQNVELNRPDVHCCGSCLLDFASLFALQQHFKQVHALQLDHYCSICSVGFVVASDLAIHNSAAHTQQSANLRRRKQIKPRRGLASDSAELGSGNLFMEEGDKVTELKTPYTSTPDGEVKNDGGTSSIRSLLQKRPLSEMHDDNDPVESNQDTLEAEAEQICRYCSIVFSDFPSFSMHCRSVHRRFPCPSCPKTFTQQVNRDRHLYNHTGERPFSCQTCGSTFTRKDALKKHQLKANHMILGSGACSMDEPSSDLMPRVDLSEDSNDEGEISQGGECGLDLSIMVDKSLETSKEKIQGVNVDSCKSVDNDDESSSNSDCKPFGVIDASVSGANSFPSHLNINEAIESEPSVQAKGLPIIRNTYTPVRPSVSPRFRLLCMDQNRTYSCDVCRESVTGAVAFEVHCRTIHRRTPCVYCGKTFSQKGNMERHQRQHTGERPFGCPYCGSSYTRKETLKVHINQAHPAVGASPGAAGGVRSSL